LDRDENAAINILKRGLSTVGHTGTFGLGPINAWGENTSTFSEAILSFASNLCEPRIPVSLERGVSTKVFYEGEQKNPASKLVVVEKIRKK
jgi:hypothetical protein